MIGNWERWTVHTAGLMRMYHLRGGFDAMENQIPLMAFWYAGFHSHNWLHC
jgi:hypothetical protein